MSAPLPVNSSMLLLPTHRHASLDIEDFIAEISASRHISDAVIHVVSTLLNGGPGGAIMALINGHQLEQIGTAMMLNPRGNTHVVVIMKRDARRAHSTIDHGQFEYAWDRAQRFARELLLSSRTRSPARRVRR